MDTYRDDYYSNAPADNDIQTRENREIGQRVNFFYMHRVNMTKMD